jgi:hypothetical protein
MKSVKKQVWNDVWRQHYNQADDQVYRSVQLKLWNRVKNQIMQNSQFWDKVQIKLKQEPNYESSNKRNILSTMDSSH